MKEIRRDALLLRLAQTDKELEVALEYIKDLASNKGRLSDDAYKARVEAYCNLEVTLTVACLIIRKLSENLFIKISEARRDDINALIHSTYFYYDQEKQLVNIKTRKGLEDVFIDDVRKMMDVILKHYRLKAL